MPKHNAIIAPVIRINPSVTKKGMEMLREAPPEGFSIEFEGKQTARLLPDERAAGILEILDELRKLNAPVYVEVHPETKVITNLLIPLVVRVSNISETKGEEVSVELDISHARHLLNRSNPDFEDLLKTLRIAKESKTLMIITETDKHEIIDVRPFPAEFKPPSPPSLPPFPPIEKWPPRWIRELPNRIWRWKWWPWWWFHCISMTKAQQVFDAMNATSCNPLAVPPPCIPFLYPDDGCWARAHEMCRLMINTGLSPKKVWIRASSGHWLHVITRNNPACYVDWGWHVAPTLCVRGPIFFLTRSMVIDPSLFSTPVSKATWKGVQGDPNATLTDSDASQYWPSGGTDPMYSDTNFRLAYYRLQLKNRSLQFGPPPYANCS
jgi:hypothetical protein